jgi:hypothetical protein
MRLGKNYKQEMLVRELSMAVAAGAIKKQRILLCTPVGNAIISIRKAPPPSKQGKFLMVGCDWKRKET